MVRECSTDSNCLDTPYTSCAVDPTDRKRRCLCADGKQPLNGDCLRKPRGITLQECTIKLLTKLVYQKAAVNNSKFKTHQS